MVKGELRPERCLRALMMSVMPVVLAACMHIGNERPVGMTLLFMNVGSEDIGVSRFDTDGLRGPVPGALGASSTEGKQMTFMPGDSKRGIPQFVEVEWTVTSPALDSWWEKNITNRTDKHSPQWNDDYETAMRRVPRYTRRIDLTPIITPELLAKVRADHQSTQLKLTVTFKNDDVSIQAEAYKWRNR